MLFDNNENMVNSMHTAGMHSILGGGRYASSLMSILPRYAGVSLPFGSEMQFSVVYATRNHSRASLVSIPSVAIKNPRPGKAQTARILGYNPPGADNAYTIS